MNKLYKMCKFKYKTMKYNKQPMSCDAQLAFGGNYRGNVWKIFCREGKFVRWDVQWEIVQSGKCLEERRREGGNVQMPMQDYNSVHVAVMIWVHHG